MSRELDDDNLVIEDEDIIIYTSITFSTKSKFAITLNNIKIDDLAIFNLESVKEILFEIKWYMYGLYDVVAIFDNLYTIVTMTKQKIILVRSN